jgi:hypothetical protein
MAAGIAQERTNYSIISSTVPDVIRSYGHDSDIECTPILIYSVLRTYSNWRKETDIYEMCL